MIFHKLSPVVIFGCFLPISSLRIPLRALFALRKSGFVNFAAARIFLLHRPANPINFRMFAGAGQRACHCLFIYNNTDITLPQEYPLRESIRLAVTSACASCFLQNESTGFRTATTSETMLSLKSTRIPSFRKGPRSDGTELTFSMRFCRRSSRGVLLFLKCYEDVCLRCLKSALAYGILEPK
jgi:hypothetical protein